MNKKGKKSAGTVCTSIIFAFAMKDHLQVVTIAVGYQIGMKIAKFFPRKLKILHSQKI